MCLACNVAPGSGTASVKLLVSPRQVIDIDDSPPSSPSLSAPASPSLGTLPASSNAQPMTLDQIDVEASRKTPAVAGPNPCYGTLLNGGTSNDEDIVVVQCGGCNAKNIVPLGKDAWYAVFAGVGVGVQKDLDTIHYLTKGIRGSHHKKYRTREMAEEAFNTARARGLVQYLTR